MNHKYAILRLDNIKLTKYLTRDEVSTAIQAFRASFIPIQVVKNCGTVWSLVEVYQV